MLELVPDIASLNFNMSSRAETVYVTRSHLCRCVSVNLSKPVPGIVSLIFKMGWKKYMIYIYIATDIAIVRKIADSEECTVSYNLSGKWR